MRPAFDSTRQAAAFALLLLILLLLPVLLTKSLLPPREQIYGWSGWDTTGAHPYNHDVIFEEKGDIDIAFMGSSRVEFGIDTPQVQKQLSAMLGRPAVVRTIAWGGAGFDELYFITKDLLQNRKVKMIVFYDEYRPDDQPNSLAPNEFRFADDGNLLAGMPLRLKFAYYNAAILGAPKNLLCLLRPNLPSDMNPAKKNFIEECFNAENIVEHLGAFAAHLGFNYSSIFNDYIPFIPYVPDTQVKPSDISVYSSETQGRFQFSGPPVPGWQLKFGREFAALARQHETNLVLLHFPMVSESRSTVIEEQEFWPDALHANISMVGVPSGMLFDGLTNENVQKLFSNNAHLNKNGQVYFTSIITPTLLKLYASQIHN